MNIIFVGLVFYIVYIADAVKKRKVVCPMNSVLCHDGTHCVERTKFCDKTNDCSDSSDELFCGNQNCTSEEFPCYHGEQCVPRLHICDHYHDCHDGSDEDVCEPSERCSLSHGRYLCRDEEQCINITKLCNNVSDCHDSSDEGDKCDAVKKRKVVCPMNSVLCHDGTHCVERTKFCDKTNDCSDSSDELFCGNQNCTSEEFPCYHGEQCVPRLHICDHHHDCHDGSDEDVCEPSERCSLSHGRYLCRDEEQCINITKLCNNVSDCHDSSDEGDKCDEALSSCKNGSCNHTCIPTPSGAVCQCNPGFLLQNNTCKDINECKNNMCSQGCINLPGSYNCSCLKGYNLQSGGHCKAEGPDPVLYIAAYNKILSYKLRSSSKETAPVVKDLTHVQNLDVDSKHLYWTDSKSMAVYMYDLESDHKPWNIVDTGLGTPAGIAVDTFTTHLYIVDSSKNRIIVCNSYGYVCVVIQENLSTPEDIVIIHKHRKLIWSEVGRNPCIMRSEMNGQRKEKFIDNDIQHPHSLAVDEPVNTLYWIDLVLARIESVKLDGSERRIVFSRKLKHPFGIAVFEDTLYWADQGHSSVMSVDKVTGRRLLPLTTDIDHVTSIVVDHPVLYQNGNQGKPCWLHECKEICLPFGSSNFTCGCPYHKKLDSDKKSCIDDVESCLYLLVGGNRSILQYPLCGIGKQENLMSYIDTADIEKVSVIDQDKSRILYSDLNKGKIAITSLEKDKNKQRSNILYSNLPTIGDVSVDWNTGIIYWTNPVHGLVQAGSINGSLVMTVVQTGLQQPNSITIDPEGGYIYFSDVGKEPKIWSCYTDGSHCDKISVVTAHVNDMVFDHDSKHLYYTDAGDHSIKALDIKNSLHVETIYSGIADDNPFYLAVYGRFLYWTDKNKRTIMSIKKADHKRMESIDLPQLQVANGLIVITSTSAIHNGCSKNNGECMHFCFVTPNGRSCKCQDGWTLNSDQKSCHEIKCNTDDCLQKETYSTEKPINSTTKSCTKFLCNDGGCIDQIYVCDKHPDCYDQSDESNCNNGDKDSGSSQVPHDENCDTSQYYKCSSGECIPLPKVCDGTVSCLNGSDESGMCARACLDSYCHQGCHPTPGGPLCYCYHGYQMLENNRYDCHDIDECKTRNGGCSQVCFNKNGSHVCSCVEGYTPSDNGAVCTATGSRPTFAVGSSSDGIFQLNDRYQRIDLDLGNTSKDVTSLDVNMKSGDIYFFSKKNGIHICSPKSKSIKAVFTELDYVTNIAYDWIGENLYVTDDVLKKLLACSVNITPLRCKTLLYGDIWRNLALYPEKGIMFIVNFGHIKQIQKLCMNGKHRQVVIETDLGMPISLTLDIPANRLYWIDEEFGKVESANLEGSDRYTVIKENAMFHFMTLDIFENDLYLADLKSASLIKLNKFGRKSPETIYHGVNDVSDVRVVHPLLQKYDKNICQPLKCSHLCLLTLDKAECACCDGYLLLAKSTDQCIDMKTHMGTISFLKATEINSGSHGDARTMKQMTEKSSILKQQTNVNGIQSSTQGTMIMTTIGQTTMKDSSSCYLQCQHGGECDNSNQEVKCVCKSGYNGKLCEIKQKVNNSSHMWVIGVGFVLVGLVLAVTTIYFIKHKRDGYNYLTCRRKMDDSEDGLVNEMAFIGPIYGNPIFQEYEDINYPSEWSDKDLNKSCLSVDSAFVSKREDSDSQSSQSSGTGSVGRYGYMQI